MSAIEKLDLWIHDTDQFSQRSDDDYALVGDDDLNNLRSIAAAIRAELADIRRQWAADAGSLGARLLTEQDETRRVMARAAEAERRLNVLTELVSRKSRALYRFTKYNGLSVGMCYAWRDEFDAALRGEPAPATGREE